MLSFIAISIFLCFVFFLKQDYQFLQKIICKINFDIKDLQNGKIFTAFEINSAAILFEKHWNIFEFDALSNKNKKVCVTNRLVVKYCIIWNRNNVMLKL